MWLQWHEKQSLRILIVEWIRQSVKCIAITTIPGHPIDRVQIRVSINVSVKQCSCWNICNIRLVLSARFFSVKYKLEIAWQPGNCFPVSLATRRSSLPRMKSVFLHFNSIATVDGLVSIVHPPDLVYVDWHTTNFYSYWPHSIVLRQHLSVPSDDQLSDCGEHHQAITDFTYLHVVSYF